MRFYCAPLVVMCVAGCSRSPTKTIEKPVHVDIYTLAADPGAFEGKRVQVQGYYFESKGLSPTGMYGPGSSVRFEARETVSSRPEALWYLGDGGVGQVVMEGTVAIGSGNSCALTDAVVLRFVPINTVTPPEFREFTHAAIQLSSSDIEERKQARAWLVEYAGEDVGDTHSAWMAWWRRNRHEAYEREVYFAVEQIMFVADAANVDARSSAEVRRGPFRGIPQEFPEVVPVVPDG